MEESQIEHAKERFYNEDWIEAHLINDTFDRLAEAGEGQGKNLTILASDLVDQTLASPGNPIIAEHPDLDVRASQHVRRETAKQAKRWWQFRQAYIADLMPVYVALDKDADGDPWRFGLSRRYESYDDKLEELSREIMESSQYLWDEDDPAYLKFYAQMERERRALEGNFLFDPLEHEKTVALRGLSNVCDLHMTELPNIEDIERRGGTGIISSDAESVQTYSLEAFRTRRRDIINIEITSVSPDLSTEQNAEYDLFYQIREDAYGIQGYQIIQGHEIPLEVSEIIDLMKATNTSEKFEFTRQQQFG